MALFKDNRTKRKVELTNDLDFFDRKIKELTERANAARAELNKLSEPQWVISPTAYDKLLRVLGADEVDATFFRDVDGAHMRYDTIEVERTKHGVRVNFVHKGVNYAGLEFDAQGVLQYPGDKVIVTGLRGVTDVRFEA